MGCRPGSGSTTGFCPKKTDVSVCLRKTSKKRKVDGVSFRRWLHSSADRFLTSVDHTRYARASRTQTDRDGGHSFGMTEPLALER